MKRIGFINWMFFFFLFLAFFHPHLKGILNSMENDYVDEKILEKSKDTHHFNESALKLYRFPFNPQSAVMADKIPYEALTHIVLPGFINRSGGNEMDSIVYQEFIDLKDNKLFKRRLEDKHLLINFKFEDFKNYSEHLNMVYVQLDSLGKYYTDSKLGIVFEVDLPLDNLALDTLINSLSALSNFIPIAKKNLQGNRDIAHYLCVNYTDDEPKGSSEIIKNSLASLFEKVDTILNPNNLKGYIIKTFDNEQNGLKTFYRLKIILKSIVEDSKSVLRRDDLIVCIPTYPVIALDTEFTEKLMPKHINIESLKDSTRVFINNNIDKIKNVDGVGYFYYATLIRRDSILLNPPRIGKKSIKSYSITPDTVEFYSPSDTLPIKKDTSEIKWEVVSGTDSLRLIKTTLFRDTTTKTSLDSIREGIFYRTKITQIDTSRITEIYWLKDMICFETQRTLQSKLDFFAEHDLNIGFWNEIEQPKVDGSTVESSDPQNPVIELFNYAKSFFKKLLKLKGQLCQTHRPDGASTCSSWDCYWETIVADYRRGLPKTPDYFLVLFAPFFALRVLMPLFSFGILSTTLSNVKRLKEGQVTLFGKSFSVNWIMFLEFLFWFCIALLFSLTMTVPGEPESVNTTRVLIVLIIIFVILGRPIIKFLIKLFRLFGKPAGKSLLKKIWKQVIPHLGTLFNTNFFDEDEMKNAIDYVRIENKQDYQTNPTVLQNLVNPDGGNVQVNNNNTEEYSFLLYNLRDPVQAELDDEEKAEKRLEYQWKRLSGFFSLKTLENPQYRKNIEEYIKLERSLTETTQTLYYHRREISNNRNWIFVIFGISQLLVSILIILAGCWLFSNDRNFVDTILNSYFVLEGTTWKIGTPWVFLAQNLFIVYFFFDYFSFYVLKLFSRYA